MYYSPELPTDLTLPQNYGFLHALLLTFNSLTTRPTTVHDPDGHYFP